jgi:import inner membrane translocase subunit TIM44
MARLNAGFEAQKQASLISDCKLIDFRHVELQKLTLLEDEVPVMIVSFSTTEILCFRNKKGEIKLGGEDNIQNARYVLAFTKKQLLDPESEISPLTNGWIIIDWARAGS